MKLVIVRHAIAEDRNPELWPNDGERPLTNRGRRRFEKAAHGIERLMPEVDLVLSSSYVRAWDTALILHEEAGWAAPTACEPLRDSPPADVVNALQPFAHLDTVAVVGHEPYLGRLLSHLLSASGGAFELKKGAAACLTLPEPGAEGGARLLWLLQPRELRLLA